MNVTEKILLLVATILGGNWIINLLTLKSQKKKAAAEASGADATTEGSELDNMGKAIKIWREIAETSEARYKALLDNYITLTTQMTGLQSKMSEMETTVKQLTSTNKLILKILKDINHDNLEQKKQEANDIAG